MRHTLAMLSLALGPGPGAWGGIGDEPLLQATGRHRALRAELKFSANTGRHDTRSRFSALKSARASVGMGLTWIYRFLAVDNLDR